MGMPETLIFFFFFFLGLIGIFGEEAEGELIQVITLTRHGDRAPDSNIVEACPRIFHSKSDVYAKFKAYPGMLTPRGIQRMRDVGTFIGQRYISGDHFDGKWLSNKGFMPPQYDTTQWEFTAREGNRQQMSMSAVSLGIFPNVPVPTIVTRRQDDNILGGPPPECGELTAKMIVDWHETKGRELLDSQPMREYVVDEVEKVCNVSLRGNPVNAAPGGPNPHCWIGDISDTSDSWYASAAKNDPFSRDLNARLTNIAYRMEQGSHFEDLRSAVWFAGGFPLRIIESFEKWSPIPGSKQPKRSPKMRLHLCSRELFYGLSHVFGFDFQSPGQPKGRVVSGSSFIWELHREEDMFHPGEYGLIVRSYYWQPGESTVVPMLEEVSLPQFRKIYEDFTKANGGPWYDQCDLEHYNDVKNIHDKNYINPEYNRTRRVSIETVKAPIKDEKTKKPEEESKNTKKRVDNIVNQEEDVDEIELPVQVQTKETFQWKRAYNKVQKNEPVVSLDESTPSSNQGTKYAMIGLATLVLGAGVYYKDSVKAVILSRGQRYDPIV